MTTLTAPACPLGDQRSPAPIAVSRWRNPRLAVGTGLALLVALGAWVAFSGGSAGSTAPKAKLTNLSGTFTVWGGGNATDPCAGAAGTAGEAVKIKTVAGVVLAQGALAAATPAAFGRGCTYPFTVPRPSAASAYVVEVGNHGSLTFTRAQMTASHWKLAMNIGTGQPTG